MYRFIQHWGGVVLLSTLISTLTGCDVQIPTLVRKQKTETPKATSTPVLTTPTPQPQPKTHKLTVTVTIPDELKVKVGDSVLKSQLLADPAATRQRLVQQRLKIQQQLRQLPLIDLPSVQPNIELQKQRVEETQQQVQVAQERLLDARTDLVKFKKDSAYTDEAWDLLAQPEERQALQERETNVDNAQLRLEDAKAKLAAAQKLLQKTPTAPKSPSSEQTRTNLQQQLKTLEQKLKPLKTVISPVTGVVKGIKPKKTENSNLSYELSILATESPPLVPDLPGVVSPAPSLNPSLTPLPLTQVTPAPIENLEN